MFSFTACLHPQEPTLEMPDSPASESLAYAFAGSAVCSGLGLDVEDGAHKEPDAVGKVDRLRRPTNQSNELTLSRAQCYASLAPDKA